MDLEGLTLSSQEKGLLQHPTVGGVILFTRNYESPEQMTALCRAIREIRSTPLLICVDQEGGRVQRFKSGMIALPSPARFGKSYDLDPDSGIRLAEAAGWIMASELLALGVDFSLAPVLDLNKGINSAIGDRALHSDPNTVTILAKALIRGMRIAGMASVGKHFPGHGSVSADSHFSLPQDTRTFESGWYEDMIPFMALMSEDLTGIMPAHIVYTAVDDQPVGFSKRWLKDILRHRMNFRGVIISDDLNMQGAAWIQNPCERAKQALGAGCDFILMCNNRRAVIEIIDHLSSHPVPYDQYHRLQGRFSETTTSLHQSERWKEQLSILKHIKTENA